MNQMLHLSATPNNSVGATTNRNSHLKLAFMKKLFTLFIAIFAMTVSSFATTYYWVGNTTSAALGAVGTLSTTLGGTGNASVITPASTDVIIFDGSDISSTAGTQTGTITFAQGSATYTIGQFILQNNATVIYSSTSSGRNLNIGGSIAGDDFVIGAGSTFTQQGSSITVDLLSGSTANWSGTYNIGAGSNTHVFQNDGTVASTANININSASITNNGTITSTGGTLTLTAGSTSVTGSAAALATQFNNVTITAGTFTDNTTTTNSLYIKGVFTNNSTFAANSKTVTFGTGGKIAGTATTTFNILTINTTNTSDIVFLNGASSTPVGPGKLIIANSGTLTLSKGVFNVGTGNTVQIGTGGGATIDASGGGNFATTGTNGSDGGNIDLRPANAGACTITGSGTLGSPTVYNMFFGDGTNGNWRLTLSTNTQMLVNGTFSNVTLSGADASNSNQFAITFNGTAGIAWAANSTLLINRGNQAYTPGKEWIAMTSGTNGTTLGYPGNVTLSNLGTNGTNLALTSARAIGGVFQSGIGSGTTYTISPDQALTCKGINITTTGILKAPSSITCNGNWVNNGAFTNNNSTITLGGSTAASISGTASSAFYNLTVNNSAGVTVSTAASVTNVLTLTSGVVTTTANLTVTNTANSAISGGGTSAYVDGPLIWTLGSGSSGTYNMPLGNGGKYYPFAFVAGSNTGSPTITAQATASAAGTADGTTLSSTSSTEYWKLVTTTGFAASSFSIGRSTPALTSENAIGKSTTNGATSYSSIAGTVGTLSSQPSINTSTSGLSGAGTLYLALSTKAIVGTISAPSYTSTAPYCPGATVTGTFTYTGSLSGFTAQLSDGSGSFASPVTLTGTVSGSGGSGTFSVALPTSGVPAASGYKIQIVASSPSTVTGTASAGFAISAGQNLTLTSGSTTQSVCAGTAISSIVYTIGGTATNAALSGAGSAGLTGTLVGSTYTITGTPTTTGSYTVTTSGTSCTVASLSGSITVTAASTANAGSALTGICQGGTSAALGGSVGGGATGGVWTDGGAGGTFSNATAISTTTYTPAATFIGTVTLTLTSTGGSPCTAATATKTLAVGGVSLYTPTGTPVLRYDFTAGANTNTGSTGTTNNASPQGSPSATTDRFGNATGAILLASASSQYITQANQLTVSGFIDAGGGSSQNVVPFSSSLWFKTSSSGQMGLMEVTDNVTGNPSNYDHALFMNGGHLFYGIYDGSNTLVSTTPTYNDNKWHNVIVTMDGTNGTVLYVDGVSVVSNAAMKHTNSGSAKYCRFGYAYLSGWSPTTVNGNSYTAGGPYYFDGSIDDILLYNSTLSSGNVTTIYGTDSTTAAATCSGSGATVTVKSNTLTSGTYTVTYNVSGTNTVSSTSASMSFNAGSGTGTFTTSTLANAGAGNIVNITALTPAGGCASATLVISTPAFSTNGISVQPATGGQSICQGSTATALTVTAIGTATYQWYSNTSATTAGATLISGATSSSYTPSTATPGTLYYYVAVTISGCGTVNSGFSGAIAVSATSVGGTAVATPGTLCNGSIATITVTGNTGSIQWQQSSDNSTWSNVTGGSGATTATYTTPALSVGLYYKALSTSGSCPAASSVSDTVTVEQSNAGNGAYTGGTWNTTPNDNTTGLGPWTLNGVGGGFAGFFTGSAPNINTNSLAWGLYANNSNTAEAIRPLTGTVSVGTTASFTLQNKSIVTGGVEGFSLYPATGTNPLMEIYFTGGNTVYTLNDAGGPTATTIHYSSTGLNISLVYTASSGNGTYILAVKPVGGSTTTLIPGSFKSTSGGGQVPAKLRFFNYNSAGGGSGSGFDFFVNSIALNRPVVVTQPSATAQNACGTASSGTALTVAAYGSNLTYQWYSNSTASNRGGSLIAGATGTSYTPPATGTTVYYYAIVSGNCATDTSTASGAITIATSSIWAGIDANWNNTANWSCGSVPTSATTVEIPTTPTGGNYPVLTAASAVNNLILDASSTLGLAGNTLTVAGAISGAGTISGSPTSTLVLNGAAGTLHFTHIPDTLLKLSLGTKATATLSNALVIAGGANTSPGKLVIGDSATLTTNDSLTLSSDNNSTAVVASIPEDNTGAATGKVTGAVTVQRYVHSNVNVPNSSQNGSFNTSINNGLRAWRMLTAPVTQSGSESIKAAWQNNGIAYDSNDPSTQGVGTLVTGPFATNGIDRVSGVSMYQWGNNAFSAISNTNVAISNGNYGGANAGNTGYMIFIRGDRDTNSVSNPNFGGININNTMLQPKGNLITGHQVYAIKKSTSSVIYTMVGNPYAAPVDIAALTNSNPVPRYFIWNPNIGGVGGFVSIDFIGGSPNFSPMPNGSNNNVNQYLQSGQAVIVEGAVAGSDGTLEFDETNKQADSNNNYAFRPAAPASVTESFVSNIYFFDTHTGTATLSDGNVAQYANGFNAGVDNIDARKLTNVNENFALLRNGIKLSIERRPVITVADTLFYSLTQTTQRNYQFQFTATALNHPGLVGFLKDSYTGDSTALNLNSSTSVNFAIDTTIAGSKNPTRFMVVFANQGTPLPVTFTGIKAAQQDATDIAISWDVQNEINISSYSVEKSTDDKTFSSIGSVTASGLGHYSLTDAGAVSGANYYRIRSVGTNGAVQYSTIAKVDIGAGSPAIAVYPNPVQDGKVGVQFTNMPAGTYGVRLLTTAGQVVSASTIKHLGGSLTQTIAFNSAWAKGVYTLEITKPDGTKATVNVAY